MIALITTKRLRELEAEEERVSRLLADAQAFALNASQVREFLVDTERLLAQAQSRLDQGIRRL